MISIVQQPPYLAPAYNDIVITVVSDKIVTKFKNKYVFDIVYALASNEIYVGRVIVTPNPSGYGMLDLGRYLQNIVSEDLLIFGGTSRILNSPATGKLSTGANSLKKYFVICGEEYSDTENGPVNLYNGNDTLCTTPILQSLYSNGCFVFNGVKQFSEGLLWNQSPYVAPTNRKFLTNSPRTLYKESDEYITTGLFAGTYIPVSGGTAFSLSGRTNIQVYDSSNTLLTTYNPAPSESYEGLNIVMLLMGVPISTVVSGYTNTWNKLVVRAGSTSGTPQTEAITIYKKECPWKKYDPVDIVWLNRLGAWDTFRFFGLKEENLKIERTTYQRQYGTWSSINYSYNTVERGTSNIETDLTLEGEVQSDFLERDYVNWLEELLTSPIVFKVGTSSTDLIPINITDTSFKKQIKGNAKLRQVSFKYSYSNQIITQQK